MRAAAAAAAGGHPGRRHADPRLRERRTRARMRVPVCGDAQASGSPARGGRFAGRSTGPGRSMIRFLATFDTRHWFNSHRHAKARRTGRRFAPWPGGMSPGAGYRCGPGGPWMQGGSAATSGAHARDLPAVRDALRPPRQAARARPRMARPARGGGRRGAGEQERGRGRGLAAPDHVRRTLRDLGLRQVCVPGQAQPVPQGRAAARL